MKAASIWKISALVASLAAILGSAALWHGYKAKTNDRQLAEKARTLRISADQGDAKAQHALGSMYYYGRGVPQDFGESLRWYRKAAEQGLAKAQYDLGFLYEYGQGVPQDYGEAVKWYRKSADQGDAKAQDAIGSMYYYGRGLPQDYAESLSWYRLAADQGLAKAQYDIGFLYNHGQGVSQNRSEALRWYKKAADQGDEYAQRAIGLRGPGLNTRGIISLSLIFLACVWVLKNRQERVLTLSGLLGLAYVGLSLYGYFGIFHSLPALNIFSLTKGLVAGIFVAGLISVFGLKSAKVVLGISATLFIGMNLFVIAHHDLKRFATTVRGFSLVNGLLLGISIPTAIFLWREHRKSTGETYQLDPADRA